MNMTKKDPDTTANMRKVVGTDMTRRRLVLASGVAMAAAVVGAPAVLRAANKPSVIGHPLDQTGILAVYAPWHDRAAKGAIDRINKAGGIDGRQVKYVVDKTASKVHIVLASFEKLVKKKVINF